MGLIQKDALRTMILSYLGIVLGYLNRGVLFFLFLKPQEVGLVNLTVSVGMLFAQCANLGTIYSVWKFFPFFKHHKEKSQGLLRLTSLIVLIGILSFALITILFKSEITYYYTEKSKEFVHYYYWIIPIGIGNVFFLLFDNYLRGLYKNIIGIFANDILLRLLILVSIILYGYQVIEFNAFIISFFLIHLAPMLVLLIYLIKSKELNFQSKRIEIPKRFQKIIVSFSLYNYINSLGALLVVTMDSLMIAAYLGLKETAVYTQVVFLTSALMIPYRSILRVSSNLIPGYWKNKEMAKMKELYQKVSSVSLFIALTLFLLVWMNINDIFSFLPKEYISGIYVFLFLMIGKVIDMYFGLNGTIFFTSKKYKYDIIFTISLIGIVFVLNQLLIPKYGIIGVAISTSISYVIYNLGRLLFVYFAYGLHPLTFKQFKLIGVFVFCLVLGEFIFPLTQNPYVNLILQSMYAVISFSGSIYLFKLEENSTNYIDNGIKFLQTKIKKRK
jgi:O-antigen/teichoic acid export membrane protein